MARKAKYVVKKIRNVCQCDSCPKKFHITWDVYKVHPDGFEFLAEFEKQSEAILVAKAMKLHKNHASTKRLKGA